jgi:CubicO group peptidase (beta-lactamase class C family)
MKLKDILIAQFIRIKHHKFKKMNLSKLLYLLILLIFFAGACNNAPIVTDTVSLPRSIPEAEGVSSQGILDFLNAAARSRHEFHSFMFLCHGKVIAEGWWNPYTPELKQTMYSLSKSFTSTAIGFAVSEKRLSVNDKVISFFPKDLPDSVSPFLKDMTVKDLLTMSAGQDPDPTFPAVETDSNWVKAFLAVPIVNDPGTMFLYNTLGTYLLSAIVQKLTGEKEIDYLTPRLFQPLGIQGMDWEVDPRGINTGGWGLRIKTEDMAKFGQLYLQKGNWNTKQLLPSAWVEEATTARILQEPDMLQSARDTNDWRQGYGYLFWRCRNNAFRGDGAYGQYIVVMPDQDAVVVITCESPALQDELNLVWKYLLPAIHKNKLPLNNNLEARLKKKLAALSLPLPDKGTNSSRVSTISGKTITFEPNSKHLESMLLHFGNDSCYMTMTLDHTDYKFTLGAGKWIGGETTKPGPDLFQDARSHSKGLSHNRIVGCYSWKDDKTLELVVRYIESPHTEKITCRFEQNEIFVDIWQSNTPLKKRIVLKGEISRSSQKAR